VHDLPVLAFEPEDQDQPRRLPRQDVVAVGKVDVEEAGDDDNVVADVLHRDVQHLNADAAGHL
jgi:hypothetical protein